MSVALRACISSSPSSFRRRRKRLETICRPPSSLTRVGDKYEILQRSEGPAAFGLSVQKTDLKPKYVYHTMLTTARGGVPPVCCPLHNYATCYRDNSPRPPPLPTPPTSFFWQNCRSDANRKVEPSSNMSRNCGASNGKKKRRRSRVSDSLMLWHHQWAYNQKVIPQ